ADSSVMSEADMHLLIHAVRKGWPTQSTTATMMVLYQLAVELARVWGHNQSRLTEITSQLEQVPQQIADILNRFDLPIADLAATEARRTLYFYAGAGP